MRASSTSEDVKPSPMEGLEELLVGEEDVGLGAKKAWMEGFVICLDVGIDIVVNRGLQIRCCRTVCVLCEHWKEIPHY